MIQLITMKSSVEAFQLQRLGKEDLVLFKSLIKLFRKVFEMGVDEKATDSYLQGLLEKPGFVVYIVRQGNIIAGGLTAYELELYYSEYAELYIYDIAVSPEFQRKGLGRQLINALKEYSRTRNIKEIFVEAHQEDAHAVDFYQAVGGEAEKVVHFNFSIG